MRCDATFGRIPFPYANDIAPRVEKRLLVSARDQSEDFAGPTGVAHILDGGWIVQGKNKFAVRLLRQRGQQDVERPGLFILDVQQDRLFLGYGLKQQPERWYRWRPINLYFRQFQICRA